MEKLFHLSCPIEEKLEIAETILKGSEDDKMNLIKFFPKKNYFLLRWTSMQIDFETKFTLDIK